MSWLQSPSGVILEPPKIKSDTVSTVSPSEAEDIKKRWQEYTEELYKNDLHDPDNHDGVITHLEPDREELKVLAVVDKNMAEKLISLYENEKVTN